MAQVVVKKSDIPLGPLRLKVFQVTHTGVTASTLTEADHGMRSIVASWINNRTNEANGKCEPDTNSSGAALGSNYVSSVTDGDVVDVFLLGR